MADEKSREPGSITKTADAQNERISGISNVSRTVSQMQKTTQRKIEETQDSIEYGGSSETTMREMNNVLSKFGKTITAFTAGVQNVSMSTAKATKDAIGDYGKAIGRDINFNKQNMVAMALSRTTPLFGYFAAKFMETDVFKKAKDRMKESIAGAFKGIGSSIANIFKGRKEAKESKTSKIPKMASGGYVEKGGMARLHAAEVVMPIEKILERIDDSISVSREIATISEKNQLKSLAKMATFVGGEKGKEPVGMVKGFLRAMREVQTQYEEPSNMRMLRAVLSIQDTLGSTIGTWDQVWTKMLIEHPTFRQLAFAAKMSSKIFGAPFKFIWKFFKLRGSYKSQLSRSDNPFQALNENIGVLYTGTMWRLDNIANFTKLGARGSTDLSSFVTGTRYPKVEGVGKGLWSLFGLARSGIGLIAKPIHKYLNKSSNKWARALAFEMESPFTNAFYKVFKHKATMKALYGSETEEGEGSPWQKLLKHMKDQPLIVSDPELTKTTKKKWLWEKLKYGKEKVKSAFGWIWKILLMGGSWIKNLLGLGTGGWLLTAVKGLGSVFGASLASAGIMGPIVAAIGAALIGASIGTFIDKWILKPYVTGPYYERMNKAQQKGIKKRGKLRGQNLSDALGQTATGKETYESKVALKTSTQLKAQKTILGTTHLAAEAIRAAQDEFIRKNKSKYAEYTPEEIAKARERWRHTWDYWNKYKFKLDRSDPEKFGTWKEAAFFKYLQKVGTKNKNLTGAIKEHELKVWNSKSAGEKAGYAARRAITEGGMTFLAERGKYALTQAGQWIVKATGKIVDAKEIAKMEASDILASSRLLKEELKKRGMDQKGNLEELSDRLQQSVSKFSNTVDTKISQVTEIINPSQGNIMGEMELRIATGNFH